MLTATDILTIKASSTYFVNGKKAGTASISFHTSSKTDFHSIMNNAVPRLKIRAAELSECRFDEIELDEMKISEV